MHEYGTIRHTTDGSGEGFSKHLPKEDSTFGIRLAGSKNHWFNLVSPVNSATKEDCPLLCQIDMSIDIPCGNLILPWKIIIFNR